MTETYTAAEFEVVREVAPYDKSVISNQWIYDVRNGKTDTDEFIASADPDRLGTDLRVIPGIRVSVQNGEAVYVGDSGKIRRAVTYVFRVFGLEPNLIYDKTMADRPIRDDPYVHTRPLAELADLAYANSSQNASVAVLMGNTEEPPANMPPKLRLAYQVRDECIAAEREGRPVERPLDTTIIRQALAYLVWRRTGQMEYQPTEGDGEEFCFLVAFGLMTLEEAAGLMPTVVDHESNRVLAIQHAMDQAERIANGEEIKIDSDDHRVIQAIAMKFNLGPESFKHPDAVAKTWPLFWKFMELAKSV